MPAPLAVQLYTLREQLSQDFAGTVRRLADIGYRGVENFNVQGVAPAQAAAIFRNLGLEVPSAHLPPPVDERAGEVIEIAQALGCRYIVSTLGSDYFNSIDQTQRTCALFNRAAEIAQSNGFTFGLHNHWWEFEQIDGRYIYQVMLEELDPRVVFEVDTYWVKAAGLDPAHVIEELGPRAPLLHIKDGPATKDQPMTAVGSGTMEWEPIFRAAAPNARWLIVELDRCATDMFEAVEQSYSYLVSGGFASGREG